MNRSIKFVYAYATHRTDGFTAAVGVQYDNGPADGSVALFQTGAHAADWARSLAGIHDCPVEILPSLAS